MPGSPMRGFGEGPGRIVSAPLGGKRIAKVEPVQVGIRVASDGAPDQSFGFGRVAGSQAHHTHQMQRAGVIPVTGKRRRKCLFRTACIAGFETGDAGVDFAFDQRSLAA